MDRILAVVPARGGSKGVVNKNIRQLGGVPLILHTIRPAIESGLFDAIAVSTDSDEIRKVIEDERGIDIIQRPRELATDESLVIDTLRHTVMHYERKGFCFDFLILLQVTSPFRTISDIREAVELLKGGADSVISVSELKEPPARIWTMRNGRLFPILDDANAFLPRQKLNPGYFINGLVYGIRVKDLKENPEAISLMFGDTVPIVIPAERALDIDSEHDFSIAEWLTQTRER